MTGKTHLASSILITTGIITAGKYSDALSAGLFSAGCIYGALLPDIDAEHSYAKNIFKVSSFLYSAIRLFPSITKRGRKIFAHRGIMHSLLLPILCLVFSIIVPVYLKPLFIGIFLGMVAHIFLDMISSGVMLFAPLNINRIQLFLRFKTGGFMDSLLCILFYGISLYFVVHLFMTKVF